MHALIVAINVLLLWLGVDLDKAQEQLARTYKMVLQRWASHVGLQSTL